MKTYQDLEKAGQSVADITAFIRKAIADHEGTEEYRIASDAMEYYAHRNVTIRKFQKYIYDYAGRKHADLFSTDHKLRTGFFNRFVKQQTQYVLSNGVSFEDSKTKDALGVNFDYKLQDAAKKAMICGKSFGFWNRDHLEVFSFVKTGNEPGFVPLHDEETGQLRAGIRYWSIGETQRATLYEEDGYTEYIQPKGEEMREHSRKTAYIRKVTSTERGGVETVNGSNYSGFPIIPMYANDLKQSEIVGIRESIDCYDFIKSGLANEIDSAAGFYWTVTGADGMDDGDLQRFVERMKVVKAATLGEGVTATAHTLEVPTDAREAIMNRLRNDLYEDFMLLDTEKALSGNLTATAIRLAYQTQDDKCGDFEYCIREFIGNLLALIGIEDEYSFKWNRIANQTEETQMVMLAANYLDEEAVLKKLPWITPEEAEEIMDRKSAEDITRLSAVEETEEVTEDGNA